MTDLDAYDVVIATRNRPDALAMSLPLILSQDPAPQRVVVVDASDEPRLVRHVVDGLAVPVGVEVELLTAPPSASGQRNRGLAEVTAPVVFFPDDDAMWHPGFAQNVLTVYAMDSERRVAVVGGREVFNLPGDTVPGYSVSHRSYLKGRLTWYKSRLERKWFPEPFVLAARALMDRHTYPSWLDFTHIVPVENISGYRISFRTEFIRRHRFEQGLGRVSHYEDVDICLRAWRTHLVLVNEAAMVKHHRWPAERDTSWNDGFRHAVNYAYVTCRHSEPRSPARRQLARWAWYRVVLYVLRIRSVGSARRAHGAFAGAFGVIWLAASSDESELRRRYEALSTRAGGPG